MDAAITPYYEEPGIQIYLGDCRAILPHLEPVDLVLTDPPYESEAHALQRRIQHEKTPGGYGRAVRVEEIPFAPMDTETRLLVSSQIGRLAKRWVLTFGQVEAAPLWRADYELAGLKYKRTCIWVKPDGMPQYSGDRPGMGYETFVTCWWGEPLGNHAASASKTDESPVGLSRLRFRGRSTHSSDLTEGGIMMHAQERILCDCRCDAPERAARSDRWSAAAGLLILLAGALLFGTGCTKEEPVVVAVQEEDTLCRAKFNNYLMRFEELTKPERERWDGFAAYMGDCLR